ncbi:hypothetical protein ACLB1M_18170 [Escherichia coli]
MPQVWHGACNAHHIIMYRQTGELKYGLNYPDAKGRFVSGDEFGTGLINIVEEGIITCGFRLTAMKISTVSPFRPEMPSIVRSVWCLIRASS